ncbi:UNVERIFIED_CONTAM: hypothetical protein FKN15_077036 [Acipenser sinensis]
MRKIMDAHTPSSDTVNTTLYYVLSTFTAPLLDKKISAEEREKLESSLNYADHCFSGHATMHAENLWPSQVSGVAHILQLVNLWNLTLQKRGCKALVAAGVHGVMQGMVLSFGGLQFTENHLQFQADPDVLHNSYSLRGLHYNKDSINLAVLLDTEGKPFLHLSVKPQDKQKISAEEREKLESSLNYADHCFSGHATMHAENLWPSQVSGVAHILQLVNLWNLTLQKRGCKALVAAGVHGVMQGMVLSFGGLQFTENHLQFQADPDVLHNSYSLRGLHYNKDSINLAVLLDTEGKPFLHLSVKPQDKQVKLYACEAGCMNEPVELTSEVKGHVFPVMVTQPITPLLYISTDLTHLQDLRHTLHLKAILAHEEHMAKQDPGLPFLFWFSMASLITLFHLFLFKLIYNEYWGPGAKALFRSKV